MTNMKFIVIRQIRVYKHGKTNYVLNLGFLHYTDTKRIFTPNYTYMQQFQSN